MVVIGLFEEREQASDVVRELRAADFSSEAISVVTRGETESAAGLREVAAGAGAGAVLGGVGGVLLGLAAFAIPGIGPVLGAGPLAIGLAGAGVGATAGGVVGAITDLGVPEQHAMYFAEALRRGATLVAVTADESLADRALAIMERHDPIDVEERGDTWRRSGWHAFDAEAHPYTTEDLARDRARYRDALAREGRARRACAFACPALPDAARRFAANLAANPHYRDAEWAVMEPEACRQWEEREPGTWDRVKDAIHACWEEERARRAA